MKWDHPLVTLAALTAAATLVVVVDFFLQLVCTHTTRISGCLVVATHLLLLLLPLLLLLLAAAVVAVSVVAVAVAMAQQRLLFESFWTIHCAWPWASVVLTSTETSLHAQFR